MKPIFFTKEGYEDKKKDQVMLFEKRKQTVEALKKAREMGDLSENGYYKAAKMELGAIDRRLRHLKALIQYGKVIRATQKTTVEIGSKVIIASEGKDVEYTIVGGYESDPSLGKISHVAPLGKALIGKKVSETFAITTPKGMYSYTLLRIL